MTRAGFSIMETLVAIALLAIAVIPLYALNQTLAQSAARLQTTTALLEAEESALAYLQAIDPVLEPEGELVLGEWRLSWTTQPVAIEQNADGYLGPGLYSVGLYEISATLERGERRRSFTLRRVSWVQSRDPLAL